MRISNLLARPAAELASLRQAFRFGQFGYPAAVGLAVFFAYPGLVAHQDVAALVSDKVEQRWLAHMPELPGNTVLPAKLGNRLPAGLPSGVDPVTTASTNRADNDPALAIRTEIKIGRDPERINRALKGDRVVSSSAVSPPENFSAGSLLERQSMLAPAKNGEKFELAFVEAKPITEAIMVASLFHDPSGKSKIADDLPVVVASLVEESAPNVLAYSNARQTIRSPFAAVLNEERPLSLVPRLDERDHAWADDALPMASFGSREQQCLTAGIYFEARGESVRGQAAVSQVILNRVRNPHYPNSICGVVYQNKKWRNRCQFSFACDRIADRVRDQQSWDIAKFVARETTEGRIWLSQVGSSTHYHATYVRPKWARKMERVGRIGLHIFYRTFGGGWS